uniref:Major facilitator superfamily (MFS) profile domain-containing protein n=1 Tax=Salvator merianae TaxID=96440 RepID=A0A8D0BSY9_SALMN
MYAQTITWTFPQTLTRQLLLATLLSGFGSSFQCGYNLTVLIYPAEFIRNFYNETYQKRSTISIDQSLLIFLWELTVSFFLFGGILGSLLVGPFVDNCGRKGTLLINSVFALISAVLMGCSKALHCYELIIISRLLIGISAGISFCAVPMYLTEIAPENLRGSIGIVAHLFIIFGTLMAQIFSLHKILGNEEGKLRRGIIWAFHHPSCTCIIHCRSLYICPWFILTGIIKLFPHW